MSLQRAQVNCKRCYTIAQALVSTGMDKKSTSLRVSRAYIDNKVYAARNAAMIALETEVRDVLQAPDFSASRPGKWNLPQVARLSLTACLECDYSEPSICKTIEAMENQAKQMEEQK